MELSGTKIRLRPLAIKDLATMAQWNCDPELQSFVDCDLPSDPQQLERWYHANVPDRNYQIFAMETLAGELIGDMELDHICWNKREAELRIRIGDRRYWGQGLGSQAIQLMLNYTMGERGFNRIYLRVYEFNERAIHCYLKNGFQQIGILQRRRSDWKNIILMEIKRQKFIGAAACQQAG
ncbi:RimJ/RimL family protein N-acetyltransferase [Hydrogenispora ethanolica]|uniref:RimJ/RimL family protein N-acetyltransferase n=1 Tax=Hydrogenispora ethanolica TaxID=1082276 RepID=A0A4V2QCX7_HYDET|nr:GNAT family N-acetyltransferase [Hydrogenispora ethanolica]TCL62097.1 RimJ/RimL family protein N-acetyltransferase [Hydrogenispora ethanolica]